MSPRRSRPAALAVAVTAVLFALSGCQLGLGSADDAPETPAVTGSGTAAAAPAATPTGSTDDSASMGSVKDAGDIPDVCTLLTEAQVTSLSGLAVTQIDEDGAQPGEASRYCQWQLAGGTLAVVLSRTTEDDFDVRVADAETIDGVGEDAYLTSGHLYVLYGTVQVDVYVRGGEEAQNLEVAKKTVDVLLPKI